MLCGVVLSDKPLLAGESAAVSAPSAEGLSVVLSGFFLPAALPSTVDMEVMPRRRVRATDDCRG